MDPRPDKSERRTSSSRIILEFCTAPGLCCEYDQAISKILPENDECFDSIPLIDVTLLAFDSTLISIILWGRLRVLRYKSP